MSNNTNIRKMTKQDKQAVIEMMRVFYTSPAVFSNGSENIFLQDIEACTGENPYLDGYIFAAPDSRRNTGLWHGGKKAFQRNLASRVHGLKTFISKIPTEDLESEAAL